MEQGVSNEGWQASDNTDSPSGAGLCSSGELAYNIVTFTRYVHGY